MSNYDKCLEMLCLTGKMPTKLIDMLCEDAMRQIDNALNLATNLRSNREERERLLFHERATDVDNWKREWLQYESEHLCNWEH